MLLLALTMKSYHVFAQSVTITLMPGWNWISCPMMDTLDFETALGSFTPAVGDMIKSQWSNASYRADGHWRGQISQFYPGYGYKYYSNRNESVTVTFNLQQPTPQVGVSTLDPIDITAVSAIVGGIVTIEEGNHIFARGVCWDTEPNPDIDGNHISNGAETGSFSNTLTELTPSTTYYVRAYVVTDYGLIYGNEIIFSTLNGIPVVTTSVVTNILGDGATCGGTVTDGGGLDIIERGVCWSTSHNPTLSDSHTTDGTGLGEFVSTLSDLMISTTYYVRAYATSAQATS